MDGTTAILRNSIFQQCHQGVFIDIFPLDSIPTDKNIFEKFKKLRMKERIKLKLYCEHHFSICNFHYNWNVLVSYLSIHRVGFNNYFHNYDDLMKMFSEKQNQLISIIALTDEAKYFRKREWYQNTLYFPFEDIQIPVPNGYDNILAKQYGDYMKPVKEPTMHGGFLILDTEHPYTEYLPKLRKEHKWDNWRIRYQQLKKILKKLYIL